MDSYEVTQKLLAFGPQYEVRKPGSDEVLFTVRGKVSIDAPRLAMVEGTGDGPELAWMRGDVTRSDYECFDAEDRSLAALSFPIAGMKRRFTLRIGSVEHTAEGGFLGGTFTCKSQSGETVLTIKKQIALRDKFRVDSTLPCEVALFAAVAVDQKYFEEE
jgi:uncharacterized protein YxjI